MKVKCKRDFISHIWCSNCFNFNSKGNFQYKLADTQLTAAIYRTRGGRIYLTLHSFISNIYVYITHTAFTNTATYVSLTAYKFGNVNVS